jgi:hypothetical protein
MNVTRSLQPSDRLIQFIVINAWRETIAKRFAYKLFGELAEMQLKRQVFSAIDTKAPTGLTKINHQGV